MQTAYHLYSGSGVYKKIKVGASFPRVGIPAIDGTAGVIPATTTDAADTVGLAIDTAVYSTTLGDPEGLVSVDVRSDLVMRARMNGGATNGTALVTLDNTAASAGGTVVTDADVGTADMVSGTIWCISGANVGQSRLITAHSSATSMTVTVPFRYAIAEDDQFLFCPYNAQGKTDGAGNVQLTTLLTEANAAIASGTGGLFTVVDLELNAALDSNVLFIAGDHVFSGVSTI